MDLYQKPFVNRGIQKQVKALDVLLSLSLYFYSLSFIVVPYKMATILKVKEAEAQPW